MGFRPPVKSPQCLAYKCEYHREDDEGVTRAELRPIASSSGSMLLFFAHSEHEYYSTINSPSAGSIGSVDLCSLQREDMFHPI